MQEKTKGSTIAMKVMCATLFLIFTVCYVYLFQCDVLAMIQYAWSGGLKHYDRNIGTVVLTSVVTCVYAVTCVFSRLPIRFYALNFWPALLLLGGLTAVNLSNGGVEVSVPCLVVFVVLLLLSFVMMQLANNYKVYMQPLRATSFMSQLWWSNLSVLLVAFCLVFALGNTNRTLHTRLAVERMCKDGDFTGALECGIPKYDNDSSLVMLRALALANRMTNDSTSMLGERLFCYDITGASRSLFPQKDRSVAFMMGNAYNLWQTIGFVPRDMSKSPAYILSRQIESERQRVIMYSDSTLSKESRDSISKPLCKPVAHDYLLCAYLLDRDLRSFVKVLPRFYAMNASMPQHYREACVLYCKVMNVNIYHDSAVEADYDDFLAVMRSNRNPVLQNSALRDAYFGTYWYYYYASRR